MINVFQNKNQKHLAFFTQVNCYCWQNTNKRPMFKFYSIFGVNIVLLNLNR